ncbi:MAG: cysteine desulfurase [Acidimicrobiaceae bacterium]|nr:cysteine desulfurase [Acidimicrobiaceae bacterium]MYL04094.1 cysteine desulfurase [Acidimicrobiaceae bacterium]
MAEPSGAPETYLDHAASTPLRPAARDAWLAAAERHHANPTGSHLAAREARRALDEARSRAASVLGADPGEIVFTSGGSEADNMAVRGALGLRGSGAAVTTEAEHHAVHDPVERSGGVFVGVDERGIVGLDALADVLGARNGDVAVVSVIAVNNETGSITPLPEVARVVRDLAPGALLHTDAVQAVNWIDVAAETAGYDLVSVTGHKVGSPVGTGVLVVRDGVELDPLIVGGGQERGRRAGTPDVAGAVSFAAALVETTEQRDASVERLRVLRDALIDGLTDRLGDRVLVSAARTNGDRGHIAAGIANVCIAGVQSEALLFLMDAAGVRASAASSCSSGAQDPSHVLAAMGVPREVALGSLRLSLGHTSVATDVERAVEVIAASVERLDRFEGG